MFLLTTRTRCDESFLLIILDFHVETYFMTTLYVLYFSLYIAHSYTVKNRVVSFMLPGMPHIWAWYAVIVLPTLWGNHFLTMISILRLNQILFSTPCASPWFFIDFWVPNSEQHTCYGDRERWQKAHNSSIDKVKIEKKENGLKVVETDSVMECTNTKSLTLQPLNGVLFISPSKWMHRTSFTA